MNTKSSEIYTRIASYWRNGNERLVRRSKRLSWLFHKLCVYICNYCTGGICIIESDYIVLAVNFLGGTAMNKQELIERYKTKYAEEPKDWKHPSVNASRQDLFANFIRDLEQLDEPQKHVMPKFVAEWIEYAKKKGDSLAISFKPWNLYGVEYSKTDRWIEDNQETFARAWLDGYEVEKEPLYYVKLKIPGATYYLIQTFLMPGDTHMCFSAATERYGAKWKNTFTEAEIKEIDERYWAFAVPVEEVVEG